MLIFARSPDQPVNLFNCRLQHSFNIIELLLEMFHSLKYICQVVPDGVELFGACVHSTAGCLLVTILVNVVEVFNQAFFNGRVVGYSLVGNLLKDRPLYALNKEDIVLVEHVFAGLRGSRDCRS